MSTSRLTWYFTPKNTPAQNGMVPSRLLPRERSDGSWDPGPWLDQEYLSQASGRIYRLTRDPWRQQPFWNMKVYEVEPGDVIQRGGGWLGARSIRLVRPVAPPDWWREAERFVEIELPTARWFEPNGDPELDWHVSSAPTWREAFRDAHRAALDAAISAVERDSALRFRDSELAGLDLLYYEFQGADEAVNTAIADARRRRAARAITDAVVHAADSAIAACSTQPDSEGTDLCRSEPDRRATAEEVGRYVRMHAIANDLPLAQEHRFVLASIWNAYRIGYWPITMLNNRLYVAAIVR